MSHRQVLQIKAFVHYRVHQVTSAPDFPDLVPFPKNLDEIGVHTVPDVDNLDGGHLGHPQTGVVQKGDNELQPRRHPLLEQPDLTY